MRPPTESTSLLTPILEQHSTEQDDMYHYASAFAALGLQDFELAKVHLGKYRDIIKDAYVMEERLNSALGHLVKLLHYRGLPLPLASDSRVLDKWHPAWRVVAETFTPYVRISREILAKFIRGRTGLSLSGGGLRAAFLHLGLVARLAECHILRSVSSISTVSGGSYIGAMLFIAIRNIVQSKPDEEITREDYMAAVMKMIQVFSSATSKDMHSGMFLNPFKNLMIAFGGDSYQRVRVLSSAINDTVIQPLLEGEDAQSGKMKMRELLITPANWDASYGSFNPRRHNWRRSHSCPALYLNCTNLNTGHLWRFTPSYMGEKADMSGGDVGIDNNVVLESVFYDDAQLKAHRDIAVSDCVSVSMNIPALISDPYVIRGLYPNMNVQLVDGGIFDNAGLQSLYHALTDTLITSEMGSDLKDLTTDTPQHTVTTLRRVLDISMDITFERIYQQLRDRAANHGIRDVCFVHPRQHNYAQPGARDNMHHQRRIAPLCSTSSEMKQVMKDIHTTSTPADSRPGIDMARVQMHRAAKLARAHSNSSVTSHSRRSKSSLDVLGAPDLSLGDVIRAQVPNVRTHIDGFTEVEKYTLMSVGYELASDALQRSADLDRHGGILNSRNRRMAIFPDRLKLLDEMGVSKEEKESMNATLDSLENMVSVEEWSFFDVHAKSNTQWPFWEVREMLQEADKIKIPHTHLHQSRGGQMHVVDHDKLAADAAETLDVASVTSNPGLQDLFYQMKNSSNLYSGYRALGSSWLASIFIVMSILGAVGGIGYWMYLTFSDFLDTGGFDDDSCMCFLEQPLFYLSIIVLSFFLLIQPGWLTQFIFAVLIYPIFSIVTTGVFEPILQSAGRKKKVWNRYQNHIRQKRTKRKQSLNKQKANIDDGDSSDSSSDSDVSGTYDSDTSSYENPSSPRSPRSPKPSKSAGASSRSKTSETRKNKNKNKNKKEDVELTPSSGKHENMIRLSSDLYKDE